MSNNNLKEVIEKSGMIGDTLAKKLGMSYMTISRIINFHANPTEEQKIKFAMLLNVSIDQIFPERYDQIYEKINTSKRDTEVEIKMMSLSSPEVMMLESGDEEKMYKNTDIELLRKYLIPSATHLPEPFLVHARALCLR